MRSLIPSFHPPRYPIPDLNQHQHPTPYEGYSLLPNPNNQQAEHRVQEAPLEIANSRRLAAVEGCVDQESQRKRDEGCVSSSTTYSPSNALEWTISPTQSASLQAYKRTQSPTGGPSRRLLPTRPANKTSLSKPTTWMQSARGIWDCDIHAPNEGKVNDSNWYVRMALLNTLQCTDMTDHQNSPKPSLEPLLYLPQACPPKSLTKRSKVRTQ